MGISRTDISAKVQIKDKVFDVEGYVEGETMTQIKTVVTSVKQDGADITAIWELLADKNNIIYAVKAAFCDKIIQKVAKVINSLPTISDDLEDISRILTGF